MLEDSSLAFSWMKRAVLEHCGRQLQRGGTADQMTEFSVVAVPGIRLSAGIRLD